MPDSTLGEQLSSISKGLGRVEGTTTAIAKDVTRINGSMADLKKEYYRHVADDHGEFAKIKIRLAWAAGAAAVLAAILSKVADKVIK